MAVTASVSRPRTLIIGFGNPLRGDDGVGQAAIAELEVRLSKSVLPHVELLDCLQLTPEMSEPLSTARRAIFIDASVALPPGKVLVHRIWPRHTPSSLGHHFTPQSILLLAATVFQHSPPSYLFTVGVDSMEPGAALSPKVVRALARVVAKIIQRLEQWQTTDAAADRRLRGRRNLVLV